VTGTRPGNYWVSTCRGSECRGAVADVMDQIIAMLDKQYATYEDVDKIKTNMCSKMTSKIPSSCSAFSPPPRATGNKLNSSPLAWSFPPLTNGCGAGSLGEVIATKVASGTHGFTGNLDQPLPGISFISACNSHDICYGKQDDKNRCDGDFLDDMQTICGSNSQCNDFAYAYRGAVGVGGSDAYQEAGKVKQCKNFKDDFARNCSNSNGPSGT